MPADDLIADYAISKVEDLPYAHEEPTCVARFKNSASDFIVRETLSFEPDGDGTHAYLYIQKTNTNTDWLARQLARFVGVEAKEIGYAGLKDRNAVTEQWFSVNLEIIEPPDWKQFKLDGVKILKQTLHRKKLKRGAIKNNRFEIILRDVQQCSADELLQRINNIGQSGVPNYYAQQRFGHDYNNLKRAVQWFSGAGKIKKRAERSIVLSAARSMVFNQMLARRIQQLGWDELIAGELMMLSGSHSVFSAAEPDDILRQRFHQGDVHPTAALWGRGLLNSELDLLSLEQQLAGELAPWCQGLEAQGLKQERRAVRIMPQDLLIRFAESTLQKVSLSFSLPSGSYATAVLREITKF